MYGKAKSIIPELGISNDSVAYYAALVDYYTVQKLQQLPSGMARLYILCFLSQRYGQINDNLINGLIHQVRKVNYAAKECMEEHVLAFQQEGHESGERVERILNLFLDRHRRLRFFRGGEETRFGILERAKLARAAQYIGAQGLDTAAVEWELAASFAPSFKPLLRPLLLRLPSLPTTKNDSLMEAVAFLRECFKGTNLARVNFERMPKVFIPSNVKAHIYRTDSDGNRSIHADRYEFLVYRLLRNRLEAGDIYVSDSLPYTLRR